MNTCVVDPPFYKPHSCNIATFFPHGSYRDRTHSTQLLQDIPTTSLGAVSVLVVLAVLRLLGDCSRTLVDPVHKKDKKSRV